MTVVDWRDPANRVLMLAPSTKDASLTEEVLHRAGISCLCCSGIEVLCRELSQGVGTILLPEEVLMHQADGSLISWLQQQPPWSDLPILVLARLGADSAAVAMAMDRLGNITVLERPMRLATLISTVRAALRARQRQYQIRDHLLERERAAAALREADRRKNEFLAVLAHELRNPLAPIRNSLQILRMTIKGDETTAELTEMMERQVNHMVRLVDDLMEVSRITRGKIELRREPIDIGTVIRNAVETSQPLIDAGGHQLSVKLPTETLMVNGDPVRLSQVIANLLNNAAKYTDSGGQIGLAVQCKDGRVEITVSDTGVGISTEMLPKVFDMFTQVPSSSGRAQGGLGIGLTLVKSLIEMHEGTIEARSAGVGHGSQFVIRLPLIVDGCPNGHPAPQQVPNSLANRRVLVVDDNRDAANSLASLLRLLGAEVLALHSGQEALDRIGQFDPTVVLLDLGMPGMDGYEVARRIRNQPRFDDLLLVALTGWAQEEDRLRSHLAGFNHHLSKPADVTVLESLLRSASTKNSATEYPVVSRSRQQVPQPTALAR